MSRAPWNTCHLPPSLLGAFLLSTCANCASCRGGCWVRNQRLIMCSLQFHKCSLSPTQSGLTPGLLWGLKPWPQSQVDLLPGMAA